ncbi:MAG: alpha-L-fucosidase [Lentisphaeria bacterium]|nr:alpha-L-fucosidase [Lentisphaeria bacterium]
MATSLEFPQRTIHLDFHTGPHVHDVGKDFNAQEFAQTFKDAHVDSVTLFATCHHGHAYWNTKRPERHPGMRKGLNLLREQVDALHAVGIRAPLYFTVQCNEFCADQHPEWVVVDPEGNAMRKWGADALTAGWQILDMSSPYADYVAEQLEEVLETFSPEDGIFMDMCWDQPSVSKWAIQAMKEEGLNPKSEADRATYARLNVHRYMERYNAIIRKAEERHGCESFGVWYNSRPKANLIEEKKYISRVEVECLPTGGWGYSYFPYVARLVRPLGLPTLSHTGKFFKSWGDNQGIKPEAALKYECCQTLALGLTLGVGDLLPPKGVPAKPVYEMIGKIYKYAEQCQSYTHKANIVSQVGLVVPPELGDRPGPAAMGATSTLQQLRQQFDIIPPSANFTDYEMLIIPECTPVDSMIANKLSTYIAQGGKLLLSINSVIDERETLLLNEAGIEDFGVSPYSHTFMHVDETIRGDIMDYGHVMYENGRRLKPVAGAKSLCQIGEPYFERDYDHFSGHEYTPENELSAFSGIIHHGNVITFSMPIFKAYGIHAQPIYRKIIGNCMDLLMPNSLLKTPDAHSRLETTVMKKDHRTIVHIVSFSVEKRGASFIRMVANKQVGLDVVEDPLPIVNQSIWIKSDTSPQQVYLAPAGTNLEFNYEDGYVKTAVTVLDGHAMIIIEG